MAETPDAVIAEVLDKFSELGLSHAVGGSFASSVWGMPRQTNDLDVVIDMPADAIAPFVRAFQQDYSVNEDSIKEAMTASGDYRSFQLLHFDTTFKIDVFLLEEHPFSVEAFARRVDSVLTSGIKAPCFSPEDTVLRKLLWYELGNRVSDRQWNDIVNVLEVQAGILDTAYMVDWAAELGVTDLLQEAMQEASVVDS
jgi:hypothetical protein